MKEFFQSILPRIQNKGEKLKHIELFVEKPWVLIDEATDELLEYEFFRDGRLLVSRGGNAAWGRWEQTPSSRLILEYGDKLLLLHTTFVDEAVMLVTKSGSTEPTMALVNQKKIPDLLYKAYLANIADLQGEIEKEEPEPQKNPSTSSQKIDPPQQGEVFGAEAEGIPVKVNRYNIKEKSDTGDDLIFLTAIPDVIHEGAQLMSINNKEALPEAKQITIKNFSGSFLIEIDSDCTVGSVTYLEAGWNKLYLLLAAALVFIMVIVLSNFV
ncbi:hypothetical protein P872_12335 [Rhodonellum psychrophilum GCM71 = DSM 17998]|uniref:Uncharacterized protein n=2 Tax=Rhodonellum TaxID=336827 RepID=U5BSQ5_9BACT|nr:MULTISPECIES: hypothetical protein [Rhodonellum]ERM80554.1 hypothetical protein P872_12335 [Rhodonellum psychrophilum GCM71 = DSM 17998]SDZ48539.1 hypothetical protein SAMN05444412_1172 [Rhodonellum ikkaensis]